MTDKPPIYSQLIAVASDLADRSIAIAVGNKDGGVRLDITNGLVGPLLAAVHAEAQRLNEQLPAEARKNASTLHATHVWISQDNEQRPMLVFELTNGSLLPLAMGSGDFAGLAAEMALLAAAPPGKAN